MLIADTHVHIYPAHDASALLASAQQNLSALAPPKSNSHLGLFLTERNNDYFFRRLASGEMKPPGSFVMESLGESGALRLIDTKNSSRLLLFAGRQIVPREGIEILCLAADADIRDGLSATETLHAVRSAGGIPVLSWAPGKWLFRRGNVIRTIVETWNREPLALGDTCMRAAGMPTPALMKLGRQCGIPVVAGSDPLPFAGDEYMVGQYGISSEAFDPDQPVTSARTLLSSGAFTTVGTRNTLIAATRRWLRNRSAKRS